jgi:hypothetical protein
VLWCLGGRHPTQETLHTHTHAEGCAHTGCAHTYKKKRGPAKTASPHSKKKFGSVLLSHTLPSAVPSAQSALATGFGMLPGVSLTLSPPKHYQHTTHHPPQASGSYVQNHKADANTNNHSLHNQHKNVTQVIGLLVPVNSIHYCTSISGLSTPSSLGGLTQHNVARKSHLEAGFPLRCFQRLSIPNVANQPCPWQNNWHTRGPSNPVLSY